MRKTMIAAGATALLLAGCGKSGPPPKREPGSWSQKFELKRLEGKGTDELRPRMEQMLAMMNTVTLCVTPEMAAKEQPAGELEKFGGNGDCTFSKKSVAGGVIDIAGTCKGPDGKSKNISATGTLGATDQDVDMTVETLDAAGAKEGVMEMRVHSTRNGACTAKDMKTPAM